MRIKETETRYLVVSFRGKRESNVSFSRSSLICIYNDSFLYMISIYIYWFSLLGNPDDPLLNPDMAYPFTNKMSLNERIWNIVYTTWTRMYYKYWHLPRAQEIVNKWMPDVSIEDIDRNFSLVILGNNHVFGYPKPLLPNVIEVHSLQITEKRETLPKVSTEFLSYSIKS